MRKGGGKSKGSAFERDICKRLSLWITDGKREDVFWRSAMSGGRATVAHRKGIVVRQAGDICAVSPEGHALTDEYFIECKHVRKLALDQFLIKGTGPLAWFWKKACKEALRHSRQPMIICRQNGWPVLVVTTASTTRLFEFVRAVVETKLVRIYKFEDWMTSSTKRKRRL